MARELKPVSFNTENKSDREILEYIEELGVSFGTYVKLLIKKDMKSSNSDNNKDDVSKYLKELVDIFKSGEIVLAQSKDSMKNEEIDKSESVETKEEHEQRLAIENMLGLGGE